MSSWVALRDAGDLAREACRRIDLAAQQAVRARNAFSLVLAGGGTPLQAYRLLARTRQDWSCWRLYYGDVRCLPADHPQRNSTLVAATGLAAKVGGHYPIPAELGAQAAAARYRARVEAAMPFDLVLLGMGEDGHTASLFPKHAWPTESVIAVHDSPKPPSNRVSLSPSALRNCRQLLVLVSGAAKRDALAAWRGGADLPIARVTAGTAAQILVERDLLEAAA